MLKVELRYSHFVKSIEEKESDLGDEYAVITFGNGAYCVCLLIDIETLTRI